MFLCCLAGWIFASTGRTTHNLARNTPDKISTMDIGRNIDAATNVGRELSKKNSP